MRSKAERVLVSSSNDEWSTPQSIFDELDSEFHFTLDPCATDQNHKCMLYYTQNEDGLLQDWGGRECSAIHRIRKRVNGLRKRTENPAKITPWLFC